MDAVRCLQCGATRWSFRSGTLGRLLAGPCETCGGTVVRERRRPGARSASSASPAAPLRERREHEDAAPLGPSIHR
jgi:hypothetical protein